ncbi:uncharacterized protein LOC112160632 [Oryzias melastigma]|uniref:uncharacterized protein LOC112160632 n=1 Tax=Oryzias melastigma TaxID=30732 RepID=UPI000CF7F10E|nr:uncharacterized protein LOC112160632 [Oryzias melastigma]
MLNSFRLSILLKALIVCLLAWKGEASSLGLTVHVVPLESDGGNTVRAHFSAITPSPCPDFSAVCAAGQDCQTHLTSTPFTGNLPAPGWCVRQWQTTVPSAYKAQLSLGSTQFNVTINAEPNIRSSTGRLNQPAYVALPPPLRAQADCPQTFQLSVKDLDGDRVQCRFAREDKGECYNCPQHSFLQLDEAKCLLTFTGKASPGQYFIDLMVEDYIPVPKSVQILENKALSSVPVQLSLTVESSTNCGTELLGTVAPQEDLLFVLPYQEVKIDVSYPLDVGSVDEFAVVGPPQLYNKRDVLKNQMTLAWIRSENNLTRLLPICFAANTKSLQSKLQCVWLYQREMTTLPTGTELKCDQTAMTLVLPLASIPNIIVDELQLNSPTCRIASNSTHLNATISLNGCGTKTVHSGSELVYTNTLRTVRPYTMVSRRPTLVLPLACRIPQVQARGPHYTVEMPSDAEVFGNVYVWIEVHQPGQGSLARYTANPRFMPNLRSLPRVRRDTGSNGSPAVATKISSRIKELDLYLMSNCSMLKVEMVVTKCVESETEDFAVSNPIMDQGCMNSNSTSEIEIGQNNSRVYRLNLESMAVKTSDVMYIMCNISLCMPTSPTGHCLFECGRAGSQSAVLDSLFSRTYTVRSGQVRLIPNPLVSPAVSPNTTTALAMAPNPAGTAQTTKNPASITAVAISHAPMTTSVTTAAILTTISVFLQKTIFY